MQRLELANKANGQPDSQKDEMYQTEIKNRDERINQLKFEIESIIQQKNKEIDALSQKMLSVMDEKDHQIKVKDSTITSKLTTAHLAIKRSWCWRQKRRQCTNRHFGRGKEVRREPAKICQISQRIRAYYGFSTL